MDETRTFDYVADFDDGTACKAGHKGAHCWHGVEDRERDALECCACRKVVWRSPLRQAVAQVVAKFGRSE
jgi:hypothetical protein